MMNNAQMFRNVYAKGGTGREYEAAAKMLAKACEVYCRLQGICNTDSSVNLGKFAMLDASPAFVYDVGEIVQVVGNGIPHYGTVTGYSTMAGYSGYRAINIESDDEHARGLRRVPEENPHVYKAMIPEGLLNLVRSQLAASCPLKEAACGR